MADPGAPGSIDIEAARAALDELTAWEPLRRSPRLCAFLSYAVEAALAGESSKLKAYAIAVDVFGRGEDFDPQSDPIVRVQARRLRALLDDFDQRGLGRSAVRILMPVGRYVPLFVPREPASEPSDVVAGPPAQTGPNMSPRSIWVAGGIALVILVASMVYWPEFSRPTTAPDIIAQPGAPLLIVEEFENLADDQRSTPLVAGLAVELVTAINQFPDLAARYGGAQAMLTDIERQAGGSVYILSGIARRDAQAIVYSVLLREGAGDGVVASFEIDIALAGQAGQGATLEEVARQVMLRLGNPRGPLHQPARGWLAGGVPEDAVLAPYPCLVAFSVFREMRIAIDASDIEACARAGIEHDQSEALAMLALLTADQGWRLGPDTEDGRALIEGGAALADRAIAAEPISGFNWAQRGYVAFIAGNSGQARDFYNTAVQLNPAAIDIVADYGFIEATLGNWEAANRLATLAFSLESDPPDFYHSVPALAALREGDYAQAVFHGERMIAGLPELGAAVLVAAAGHMRDMSVANRYLPRLLASQRYRRQGIMPALRHNISDTELLRVLLSGILQAGVPLDRLVAPL